MIYISNIRDQFTVLGQTSDGQTSGRTNVGRDKRPADKRMSGPTSGGDKRRAGQTSVWDKRRAGTNVCLVAKKNPPKIIIPWTTRALLHTNTYRYISIIF